MSDDPKQMGSYTVTLRGSLLVPHEYKFATAEFKITVMDPCVLNSTCAS